MSTTTAKNRRKPRPASRRGTISRLETIQDLLAAIRAHEPDNNHLLAMLGATTAHIAIHLGEPADKIDIHRLLDVKAGLQAHLRKRGFRRNSIRSYTNYLRILLQKAGELGWA